jgi:hypothetical protein
VNHPVNAARPSRPGILQIFQMVTHNTLPIRARESGLANLLVLFSPAPLKER